MPQCTVNGILNWFLIFIHNYGTPSNTGTGVHNIVTDKAEKMVYQQGTQLGENCL